MNAAMIAENCPNCLALGVIVDLVVDFTQKEIIYSCPACGFRFTEHDLQRIYEHLLSKLNGGKDEED